MAACSRKYWDQQGETAKARNGIQSACMLSTRVVSVSPLTLLGDYHDAHVPGGHGASWEDNLHNFLLR